MKNVEDMKLILYVAIARSDEKPINVVLPYLDLREKIHKDCTALHTAMKHKSSAKVIDLLIKRGAPLEATDDKGRTPFDYAIMLGDDERAKILIKAGAKFDRPFSKGKTYLDFFELEYPEKFQGLMSVVNEVSSAKPAPDVDAEIVPPENPIIGYMYGLMRSLGFNSNGSGYNRLPAEEPCNHKKNN